MKLLTLGFALSALGGGAVLYGPALTTIIAPDWSGASYACTAIGMSLVGLGTLILSFGFLSISVTNHDE